MKYKQSIISFIKILLFIICFSLFFTFLTFLAEYQENPDFNFQNFLWWWLTTISTVGYGDLVPITSLGKFFASFVLVSSILFVAVGISQISSIFMLLIQKNEMGLKKIKYKKHIVIINTNRFFEYFLDIFNELLPDRKVVLLSIDKPALKESKKYEYIHGDPTYIPDLERCNVSECSLCIILPRTDIIYPDFYSLVIAAEIEKINNDILTIIDLVEEKNIKVFNELKSLKADIVFTHKDLESVFTLQKKKENIRKTIENLKNKLN